jgi:hypothetical protein
MHVASAEDMVSSEAQRQVAQLLGVPKGTAALLLTTA